MKKFIYLNISLLFLFSTFISAQDNLSESDLKETVSKIFNLCSNKDYKSMAEILLFKDGKNFRTYNYSQKSEAKKVKRQCKKIKAYLDLSDSYEYDTFVNGNYESLPSTKLNIIFISGDQKLKISFEFVKLNGKILLASFK